MTDQIDWTEWYDMTRLQPPTTLLVKALSYNINTGKVLDIGGGALKDTRYLLDKGFDVTVIDKSPLLIKEAGRIKSKKLHPLVTSFEDFNFPVDEYVLVSAMHCLSYCEAENFNRVIENIKLSLKKGGIFCGQMYDGYGQWSKEPNRIHRTYKTVDEIKDLLKGLNILFFQEQETEKGRTKLWHIYDFIVRK